MYSLSTLAAIAVTLLPALTTSTPLSSASPLRSMFKRNTSWPPMCTGCGAGHTAAEYAGLIAQLDASTTYTLPWNSDALTGGWEKLNDGEPSMSASLCDSSGNYVPTAGTIIGSLLISNLNTLNGLVTDDQDACASGDGTYLYGLGETMNCGGG